MDICILICELTVVLDGAAVTVEVLSTVKVLSAFDDVADPFLDDADC